MKKIKPLTHEERLKPSDLFSLGKRRRGEGVYASHKKKKVAVRGKMMTFCTIFTTSLVPRRRIILF